MEPETIAEYWDCELERSEVGQKWVNENLMVFIRRKLVTLSPTNIYVQKQLKVIAEERADLIELNQYDRILTFSDQSRLALFDLAANTIKGVSRVMSPGDNATRARVRNGQRYVHGTTKTAWYWTVNGKVFNGVTPPYAKTGEACPKKGLWVKRFCSRGCADMEEPLLFAIQAGDQMAPCSLCISEAVWGWAAC